ncbi:MAG: hypothetical protein FWE03_04960 [Firmicutes bacterium]|nr:hypothetical protein [Bacillota bacterium]
MLLGDICEAKINRTPQYQIRYYDFLPAKNCIITDNYVFVHYHVDGLHGRRIPVFAVKRRKKDGEVYSFYSKLIGHNCVEQADCSCYWCKSSPIS